jgi:predicted ATPase
VQIYICGAHSTGKTTLAKYISKKYEIPMIAEVARQVLAEMEIDFRTLRTNMDLLKQYQMAIFYRQIEEEKKHKSFVSDRTFDSLAYAGRHGLEFVKALMESKVGKDYFEKVKNSIVFFVRPDRVCLANDAGRETVIWDEIVSIDAIIDFLLTYLEVNAVGIAEQSMKRRIQTVQAILSPYELQDCPATSIESEESAFAENPGLSSDQTYNSTGIF